jgi:hypothetical protein
MSIYNELLHRLRTMAVQDSEGRVVVPREDFEQLLVLFEAWTTNTLGRGGLPGTETLPLGHTWKPEFDLPMEGKLVPGRWVCHGGCGLSTRAPYDALCAGKVSAVLRRLHRHIRLQQGEIDELREARSTK